MAEQRYLLDTNIVSDLVRNPQGRIARKIDNVGEFRRVAGLKVRNWLDG